MKRTLFLSILIVLFTISFVGCDNKLSTKELYNLQEKCGKQSEEWYGNKDKPLSYQSHYNKKLNKCFILVSVNTDSDYQGEMLFDVNENKEYGTYVRGKKSDTIDLCDVLEKECKSFEEWKSLIKPYMEE
ncbi:MAG: hypothetical protein ACYDGO_06380 [Smithellaceae bacterium]